MQVYTRYDVRVPWELLGSVPLTTAVLFCLHPPFDHPPEDLLPLPCVYFTSSTRSRGYTVWLFTGKTARIKYLPGVYIVRLGAGRRGG